VNKKTRIQTRQEMPCNPKSRAPRDRDASEEYIESRLQHLRYLVDGFCDVANPRLLTQTIHVREALEELLVKEAAMRWIVRIAKRSNGSIREALWSDIEKSLADLEKTAESVIRTEVN
jgi:hypothetical protein